MTVSKCIGVVAAEREGDDWSKTNIVVIKEDI